MHLCWLGCFPALFLVAFTFTVVWTWHLAQKYGLVHGVKRPLLCDAGSHGIAYQAYARGLSVSAILLLGSAISRFLLLEDVLDDINTHETDESHEWGVIALAFACVSALCMACMGIFSIATHYMIHQVAVSCFMVTGILYFMSFNVSISAIPGGHAQAETAYQAYRWIVASAMALFVCTSIQFVLRSQKLAALRREVYNNTTMVPAEKKVEQQNTEPEVTQGQKHQEEEEAVHSSPRAAATPADIQLRDINTTLSSDELTRSASSGNPIPSTETGGTTGPTEAAPSPAPLSADEAYAKDMQLYEEIKVLLDRAAIAQYCAVACVPLFIGCFVYDFASDACT